MQWSNVHLCACIACIDILACKTFFVINPCMPLSWPRLEVKATRTHKDRSTARKKMGFPALITNPGWFAHTLTLHLHILSIYKPSLHRQKDSLDNEHVYIWSSSIKQPLPGWRTEAQIAALHSSERVAKGIVANKEAEGLVDKHPDDPTLTTYYVPCHLVFVDAFSKCMEAMKEIWKKHNVQWYFAVVLDFFFFDFNFFEW